MKNEIKKVLKICLLFIVLFFVNILVLKTVSSIGFKVVTSGMSYLFPPLFSTGVLLILNKKLGRAG